MLNVESLPTDVIISKLEEHQIAIFETRFEARMKQIDIIDIDYINNVGMMTSGIGWLDNEMDEQLSDVYLTVNQMVEYIQEGKSFHLVNPYVNAEKVYKLICNYVNLYAEASGRVPNLPLPPQEDFEALDFAAARIYELYRCYEKPVELKGLIGRFRTARARRFTDEAINKEVTTDEQGNPIIKQHNPLIEAFDYRLTIKKAPEL